MRLTALLQAHDILQPCGIHQTRSIGHCAERQRTQAVCMTAWRCGDTVYRHVTGRKGGLLTLRCVGASWSSCGAQGCACVGRASGGGIHSRTPPQPRLATDPFTLGVASGDPASDGAVIWTRLAPNPLADDGLGGMPARVVDVEWEVAADERFTHVEQRGLVSATPDGAHSVHVELTGLRPGADYFYRFRTGGYVSPAGRTRTAPEPGSMASMTMCVASCSNFEQGWFTAYRHLADENPDLVVHLGDYQYEYAAGAGGTVREHVGPETVTLANYRQRYAQYKTDKDLQAAHACAPWLVVFDDHEVADNWADEVPEKPDPAFLDRRAAALRAYYENMPLRRSSMPRGIDMQLYRRVHWGGLATLHMLDTRQYRDDQPCGDDISLVCRAGRPGPVADGRRAGTLATQRVCAVQCAVGCAWSAGVLLAGGADTRPPARIQPGRLGRVRRQSGPDRARDRRIAGTQCGGADGRRAFALGRRGALAQSTTHRRRWWRRSW